MTAITTEACEAAMDKARAQDNPDGAAAIKRQSFVCKRRGREVSPAQCSDCFEAKSYTERFKYHENRQNCIEENKLKPKAAKGKIVKENPLPPDKEIKPLASSESPVPDKSDQTRGLNPLAIGTEVEVKGKGQYPIRVQITQELMDDHETAFKYAAQAAHDKMRGEILLSVAIALYAGDSSFSTEELGDYENLGALPDGLKEERVPDGALPSSHLRNLERQINGKYPWAIDGYATFEEAMKDTFGLVRRPAFYRAAIGRALIKHYGKENVIAKAEEMGIAQIPYYKLRELLKAPRFFEALCTQGCARLASGDEVTTGWVLQHGIAEFPNLINQFAGPKTHHALEKKTSRESLEEWKKNDPFKNVPLGKKAQLIATDYFSIRLKLIEVRDEFIQRLKGWPKDSTEIFGVAPEIQEEYRKIEGILCALSSALMLSAHDPDLAQQAAYDERGRMTDLMGITGMEDGKKEDGQEPDPKL